MIELLIGFYLGGAVLTAFNCAKALIEDEVLDWTAGLFLLLTFVAWPYATYVMWKTEDDEE